MDADNDLKRSFAPVVDANTRVLVLGSLPGERSLREGRYYAHPQNQFWTLIGSVIDRDLVPLAYAARLAALRAAGVGLWDVVDSARRRGSSDAAIRDHRTNDLPALVARLPRLRAVAFNGGTAARIGTAALAEGGNGSALAFIPLPSSSPLHTIGVTAKRPAWLSLRTYLD